MVESVRASARVRSVPRPWVFLTFGGGSWRWRAAAERLARQARRSGIFADVLCVTDRDLRRRYPGFWDAHSEFVQRHPRGFGYWLWKPFLITQLLAGSRDEVAGVLYVDAGCELNLRPRAVERLHDYLDSAEREGFLGMAMDVRLRAWCKPEVLTFFGLGEAAMEAPVIAACVVAFANDPVGRAASDEWWSSATAEGSALLTDETAGTPQWDGFVAHRHDQALLSCIVANRELSAIPDETYFAPAWSAGVDFPIWALRNRLPISVKPGSLGGRLQTARGALRRLPMRPRVPPFARRLRRLLISQGPAGEGRAER